MAADIEKLIQEIGSLPPEDRRRVHDALAAGLSNETKPDDGRNQEADVAYQELLVGAGLIGRVNPRHPDQQSFERFKPQNVLGEPLSETIVKERR